MSSLETNSLLENLPYLVENLDIDIILISLKGHFTRDEWHWISHQNDKVLTLYDIIERHCHLDDLTLLNKFMITLAGLDPECFEVLASRPPTITEGAESISYFIETLKQTIQQIGHKTDKPLDRRIDLERNYIQLRVVQVQRSQLSSHYDNYHPMTYQTSLSESDIDIEDILEEKDSDGKFLLMRGRCGIGKTTMTQHLSHRWAYNHCLEKFPCIFLIPIRRLSLTSKSTLHEVLTKYSLYQNNVPIAWIVNWQNIVLLMIDGLDEIPNLSRRLRNVREIKDVKEEATQEEIILNLLKRNLLAGVTLVCTSRVFEALGDLKPDLDLEVMGLTKKGVHEFIGKNVAAEKQMHVKGYLARNPLMMSICSITFYASLLCSLLEKGQNFSEVAVQTYTRLTSLLVMAYAQREDTDKLGKIRFRESFRVLAEIAFNAQSGEGGLTKISFDLDDLDDILVKSTNVSDAIEAAKDHGFVHITDVVVDDKRKQVLEFPHLCQQELFAAVEFLRCGTKDSEGRFEELLEGGALDMFQLFVYGVALDNSPSDDLKVLKRCVLGNEGLSSEKKTFLCNSFEKLLLKSLSPETLLKVSQMAYEAQNDELAEKVSKVISAKKDLKISYQPLNVLDFRALAFSCRFATLEKLTLKEVNLDARSTTMLVKILKEQRNLRLLNLSLNIIEGAGGQAIGNLLKYNKSLTEIILWNCKIGDEGAEAIADGLNGNVSVQIVSLRGNGIGNKGAKALSQALSSQNVSGFDGETLENVNEIVDSPMVTDDLLLQGSVSTDLSKKTRKEQTNEPMVTSNEEGAVPMTKPSVENLYLGWNAIGTEGAMAIGQALVSNTSLIHLELDYNTIGDQGAAAIAAGLKKNTTLKSISLRRNGIGDEGCKALAVLLTYNAQLTNLYLQTNDISDYGGSAINLALLQNTSMRKIMLYGNKIQVSWKGFKDRVFF